MVFFTLVPLRGDVYGVGMATLESSLKSKQRLCFLGSPGRCGLVVNGQHSGDGVG